VSDSNVKLETEVDSPVIGQATSSISTVAKREPEPEESDSSVKLETGEDSPVTGQATFSISTGAKAKLEPKLELSDNNLKLEAEEHSHIATSSTAVPDQATSSLEEAIDQSPSSSSTVAKQPRRDEVPDQASSFSLPTVMKRNAVLDQAPSPSLANVKRNEAPDQAPSSSCTTVKREEAIRPEVVKSEGHYGRSADPSRSFGKRRLEKKGDEETSSLKKKRYC
jgi:hypothetical protein